MYLKLPGTHHLTRLVLAMATEQPIVIIGAGPVGLVAALTLLQQGQKVVIYTRWLEAVMGLEQVLCTLIRSKYIRS